MPQVHLRLAYFIFGGHAKRAVEFSLLRKSYSLRSWATVSARLSNSFAAMRGHLVWRAHISNGSPVAKIRSWQWAKYRSWSKAAITPKAASSAMEATSGAKNSNAKSTISHAISLDFTLADSIFATTTKEIFAPAATSKSWN